MYDELVTKVNAVNSKISNTSGLTTKIKYDSGKR